MATVAWTPGERTALPRLRVAEEHRAFALLLAVAAMLTIVDGLATLVWLHLGHAEANPLLVALIAQIGAAPAMAVRIVVGLALLGLLAVTLGRARLAPYAVVGVTGVLTAVGLWHGYGVVLHVTGA